MEDKVIGKCSNCGKCVTTPSVWDGTTPARPECKACGFVKSPQELPEITMQPKNESGQQFLQD